MDRAVFPSRISVVDPVVVLQKVDSLPVALALANEPAFSLHAGIFANDLRAALDAAQALEAGGVMIKDSSDFVTPVVMSNSYGLPDDPSRMDWSDSQRLFYTRNSGHNQMCLERKLAANDGC